MWARKAIRCCVNVVLGMRYVCVSACGSCVCKCRALASSRGSSYDLKNEICFCVASLMAYTFCVCNKFII